MKHLFVFLLFSTLLAALSAVGRADAMQTTGQFEYDPTLDPGLPTAMPLKQGAWAIAPPWDHESLEVFNQVRPTAWYLPLLFINDNGYGEARDDWYVHGDELAFVKYFHPHYNRRGQGRHRDRF